MTTLGPTAFDGELLGRLAGLDACSVSDALDTLGLPGAVVGLRSLSRLARVVVGRVRTVQAVAKADGQPGTHIASPLIAIADPGDVIVIANDGREDVSCFGGILAVAALERGIAGVVIDGACRDIAESEELGLPVFGRAVVPVSARGRIVQAAMDVPIRVAGVAVCPGDVVVADRSGVVFLPAADAGRIVSLAERVALRERAMVAAIRGGDSVVEVMHDTRFPGADAP